jgi:hypothetical protein
VDLTHKEGRQRVDSLVDKIKPARKIQDLSSFRTVLLENEIEELVPDYMPIVTELEYLQSELAYTISLYKQNKDITHKLDFLLERIYRLYKHPRIGGICTQVLQSDFELVDELRSGTLPQTEEYLFQIQKDLFQLQLIYQTIVDSIDTIEEDHEDVMIKSIQLDSGLSSSEKQAMIFDPSQSTREKLRGDC